MKKNYKMKKTISVKMFISEFGENFSEHIKKRLMDLEVRCVLTRKNSNYIVDVKHVEHLKYTSSEESEFAGLKREYIYGKFAVADGILYFSKDFEDTKDTMKCEVVDNIYNSLSTNEIVIDEEGNTEGNTDESINAREVNDDNIDFIIDSILEKCPQVSQKYLDIVHEMLSHADIKRKNTLHISTY
ncbi:hypothetical protein ACSVC9_01720 [Clostridium sp. LBM24168]